jgi:hypothetical protein
MSSQPHHPGKIVYIDGNTNDVTETLEISEVPENLRFAPTEKGLVPIVRVVAYTSGDQRIIREYGPENVLLRSTVQLKSA